jgi:hypothetical protein
MNCTDAYHDALTRHFSATAAPARPRTTAPSQRRAAEQGQPPANGDGSGTVGDGAEPGGLVEPTLE